MAKDLMTLFPNEHYILADGRWNGAHGIGRFSNEIIARLKNSDIQTHGPKPLSLKNLYWQPYYLQKVRTKYKVYFNPGFNPILFSPIPYVFTICDLIHLQLPGSAKYLKQAYYQALVKPAARRAYKVLTISEYSKQCIIEWSGLTENHIINVGCGISSHLTPQGEKHNPGYPYFLHVGNTTKPHKNVARLLQAFAAAKIDNEIRLILTGSNNSELSEIIKNLSLEKRIIFSGTIEDSALPAYYRGALALLFPSLYEGFGLPPLEAMACGTPALTSKTSSLPEVTGDAAILVCPTEIDAIADGIEKILIEDTRQSLIIKGLKQASLFSWDKTAAKVQTILNAAV
jgi:glycosyltransferase involved in cell wall biosynthesis